MMEGSSQGVGRAPMMDTPLTPLHFIARAAAFFGEKEVVSWRGAPGSVAGEGDAGGGAAHVADPVGREITGCDIAESTRRLTWRAVYRRSLGVTSMLRAMGIRPGDRVATLAWNHHRHLELYFGVPGAGAVLLTVNGRLAPEQVGAILEEGGARAVFADPDFAALIEGGAPPSQVEHRVLLAGSGGASGGVPEGWASFEELLASATAEGGRAVASFRIPEDENEAAGLCFTSGTTGEPKGVLYSHRALALHTLAIALPDAFGLGERDVILPAVPMFHANAWGLPLAAAMTGATLVLPGPRPDARRLVRLMEAEAVTFAAGVPTVWGDVLEELRRTSPELAPGLRIHSGGAPTPPSLIRAYAEEFGVEILCGWGMTELTPVGMVTRPRVDMAGLSADAFLEVRRSQGTPLPFVEARVVDGEGKEVVRDGRAKGELEVRGPWVAAGYLGGKDAGSFRNGWLRTGDVATMDARGYVRIVDRTKDLIRSGGEWISSIQLEHALMAHPAVREAAVVAVPHPRWGERPWAYLVAEEGVRPPVDEILGSLQASFPRWWIPDGASLVSELPRTATGKTDKKVLRDVGAG
ncbi:MAG: long-chain-fatty-acid--CoA ligase [Gemmatimonadota bacterium]